HFDVVALVNGGGMAGQSGALRLGVARALDEVDLEANRHSLKKAGLLTRDARIKERKKAGLKKASKAPQYSKRGRCRGSPSRDRRCPGYSQPRSNRRAGITAIRRRRPSAGRYRRIVRPAPQRSGGT